MILIASIVGGSLIGYRIGASRRGTRLFLIAWLAVFAFQTAVLLATSDNPRDRETGAWDLGYFPFALLVLVGGVAVLHGAAAVRRRRTVGTDIDAAR